MLRRFGANGLRTWPADYQREFFAACTAVMAERFDRSLDAGLRGRRKGPRRLVRAGDLGAVLRYVDADSAVTTRAEVGRGRAGGTSLSLRLRVSLEGAAGPQTFHETAGTGPDGPLVTPGR